MALIYILLLTNSVKYLLMYLLVTHIYLPFQNFGCLLSFYLKHRDRLKVVNYFEYLSKGKFFEIDTGPHDQNGSSEKVNITSLTSLINMGFRIIPNCVLPKQYP